MRIYSRLFTDLDVKRIYFVIWQSLDLKNQHQSKGRLFQSSYLYDLLFKLFAAVVYFTLF